MLAVYLTALVAGGFFVGLSALGGGDTEADAGFDELGTDIELDGDADLDVDASASIAEASHGVRKGIKRGFNPLLSFRFWTFTSAFFGLTGAALSTLTSSIEPFTLTISAAMGITCGLTVSWLVNSLKSPVSSGPSAVSDYVGLVGPLMVPLKPGGTSKVRLRLDQKDIEILATSATERVIPKGTQVVILGFTEDGIARVDLDQSLFLESQE